MVLHPVHGSLQGESVEDLQLPHARASISFCRVDGKHENRCFILNGEHAIGCRFCVFLPARGNLANTIDALSAYHPFTPGDVVDFWHGRARSDDTPTTKGSTSPIRPRDLDKRDFDSAFGNDRCLPDPDEWFRKVLNPKAPLDPTTSSGFRNGLNPKAPLDPTTSSGFRDGLNPKAPLDPTTSSGFRNGLNPKAPLDPTTSSGFRDGLNPKAPLDPNQGADVSDATFAELLDVDEVVATSPPKKSRYDVRAPTTFTPLADDFDGPTNNGPRRAAWGKLPDDAIRARALAASKRQVSTKTMAKYTSWINQHWAPFARAKRIKISDLDPETVCYWIEWMVEPGTRSRGTIINYINALAWKWRQYDANVDKEDIFLSKEVLNVRDGLNKRIVIKKPLDRRVPIHPADMMKIKDFVVFTISRFKYCYEDWKSHVKFDASELKGLRAGVACLVAYTFGLRSCQLYHLPFSRFIFENDREWYFHRNWRKFGLVMDDASPGDKTHQRGCARSGMDRVMTSSAWSDQLHQIVEDYVDCVRTFYSVRLKDDEDTTFAKWNIVDSKENKDRFEALEPASIADDLWFHHKTRLSFASLPKRVFHLPFLSYNGGHDEVEEVSQGNENLVVTSWLKHARKSAVCGPVPRGTCLTSHSLRSGAASGFHCVQEHSDMARLSWWFRWNVNSDTAQDHYIEQQWTRRDHPDAEYFWMSLARKEDE